MVPNLVIFVFFFHKIFQIDKLEGVDFKYDNIFFKILAQKYSNETFLVPNIFIFFFWRFFAIRKIRGCSFQIYKKHSQIRAPNQAFLVPSLRIFVFAPKFVIRHIRGRWFQIWQWFSWYCCPKHPIKAFLVPDLRI